MKATEYLKTQHREVERLFAAIEQAEDGVEKQELFEQLAANLVAHDAIEREIFYPACEDRMGVNDVLGEALVEHGLVEFSLLRADENIGTEYFDHFISVLKENVEHHVKEEENQLLPLVENYIEAAELEELTEKLEARFAAALASDYRAPLVENVREVLAGALKTGKENVDEVAEERAAKAPAKPSKKKAKTTHRAHHR
jgi:hypothetical protein